MDLYSIEIDNSARRLTIAANETDDNGSMRAAEVAIEVAGSVMANKSCMTEGSVATIQDYFEAVERKF